MKKTKLITIILLVIMSMMGCQLKQVEDQEQEQPSIFNKSVEEGKLAMADEDYEKASNMFKLALEERQDDEISKLNKQCELVIKLVEESEKLEDTEYTDKISLEKDLNNILEICEEIINIDSDSKLIKDKVKEAKKELDKAKLELEKVKNENKQEVSSNIETEQKVNSQSNNYTCAICGAKTNTLCEYDQCDPLCKDDMGYYCECGEYHHTQNLCPIFDM